MKILVVCQYYYPEPFRISDICEALVHKGHKVTVLTGLPNYPEGRVLDDYRHGKKRFELLNGVNIIRCYEIGRGKDRFKLFLNYFSYAISATWKMLFLKGEYDVVFIFQLSPIMMAIPGIIYKKKHKKKILLYCQDLWPGSLEAGGVKKDTIIYNIFFKVSKWIYGSADLIIVTSSMFKDYFKNILKINTEFIKYLPQYAEDLFTQSVKMQKNNKAEKYNFVFAGNIGEIQSVETIIKAANELKNHSNITFHIIGYGSKFDECKQFSDRLGLKNVLFYGRRPIEEMPEYYSTADAMLVTLKDNKFLSYTLPAKVQSYMAAGKPIIGSIDGETKRVIEDANCGFCCQAEDYKGLAEIILKFCMSENKEQMALNAKKYYDKNFSKGHFLATLEQALFSLKQ
jgi:glycosyltransferase involved in cell wall biosynthesis